MKYLIIQTRDIGDVMLSTALCNALKQSYPEAQVDMLTMDHCVGVVEGNPNIDEIIVLIKKRRNSIRYVYRFLKDIRSRKYDAILNVQGQLVGLLTCLFSRSSRRVGDNKFPWRMAHTDNVQLPSSDPPTGECHAIDIRFAMMKPLLNVALSRSYRIWLSEAELNAGREMLLSAGLNLDKPIVALGVNSRDDYKQWPLRYFAELSQWLLESFDIQIFVFFGPGEETYSRGLKTLLPEEMHQRVFDQVHTRSIRELAMLFPHCALYVGNDTGPRHIAQASRIPAFAVVSPASNKWGWVPWHNPRYRAVDTGDALGLSSDEWLEIRNGLTWGVDDAEWFDKLAPAFVQEKLAAMISELGLFTDTVSDKD